MALRVPPERGGEGVGNGTVAVEMDVEAFNERGILVDSGTTESFLPSVAREPFQAVFEGLTGEVLKQAYPKSAFGGRDVDDVLPTIVLRLRAWRENPYLASGAPVELEIEPRKYLRYDARSETLRLGLHLTEEAGLGILGANFMFGHDILFDVERGRIGFAKSDCDYGRLQV